MQTTCTDLSLSRLKQRIAASAKLASISALLLLSAAASASAATLTYTYTGTISSGIDTPGLFGAAGSDLTGVSFTAVETFDTSKIVTEFADGSSNDDIYGGPYNGGSSGFSSASIKIGSSAPAFTISGDNSYSNNETANLNANLVQQFSPYTYAEFTAYSTLIPYDVRTSFSATLSLDSSGLFNDGYDYIYLQPSTLTVSNSDISAVPLPASLPLFAGGLLAVSALGHLARRRTKRGVGGSLMAA